MMSGVIVGGMPFWHVIHTKPKQEDRASSNLRAWNVETFAPKIRGQCFNEFTGRPIYITKPLFPGYIFAKFAVETLWHKVSFTRGVQNVLCIDGWPARVDEEIISIIESQKDKDGFIRLREELYQGDRVLIKSGPLRNLVGVFEAKLKDEDRAAILLTTVSYQNRVLIDTMALKKIS